MSINNGDTGLTAAVVFTGVAISASLIFIGFQMNGDMMPRGDKNIEQADKGDKKDDKKNVKEDVKKENEGSGGSEARKIDPDFDHIRGNKDARITVIEYSDFECPFCQRVHPIIKKVVDEYDGDVNWVYRHFPLSFHEPAASAMSEASECAAEVAGNGKFWEYADELYAGQVTGDDASLIALASKLNIDKVKFQKCIESDKYDQRIADDLQDGVDAGVTGTPGNIIVDNETGESVSIVGAQPFENFKSKIDGFLSK